MPPSDSTAYPHPVLADNIASARTIERNAGVLEGIRDTAHGPVRRYWIALDR